MKKTLILAVIISFFNVFSTIAQSTSNIDILGTFEELQLYETYMNGFRQRE